MMLINDNITNLIIEQTNTFEFGVNVICKLIYVHRNYIVQDPATRFQI